MGEPSRRREKRLWIVLVLPVVASLLLMGGAWWSASLSNVRSSYPDVHPPQILWSQPSTTNGSVTGGRGPVVGLSFRVEPDSFSPRADRVYAALEQRVIAFDARDGGAEWWRDVDDGVGPVSVDFGDGITFADFETYMGTGAETLRIYNDTAAGDPLIQDLALGSRVVAVSAYASNASGARSPQDLILAATEDGTLLGIRAANHTVAWQASFPPPIGLASQRRTMVGLRTGSAAFTSDGARAVLRAGTGQVYGIETATGSLVFMYGSSTASADPVAFPSMGGERFLVGFSDGSLAVFDTDGNLVGSSPVGRSAISRIAAGFEVALAVDVGGEVARVNLPNGGGAPRVSWRVQLAGPPAGPPAFVTERGTLFLADTTGRVTALRLDGGSLEYRIRVCNSVTAGPVSWVPQQSLSYFVGVGCADGSVFALDSRSAPRPVP